jgi:hypothetical protein
MPAFDNALALVCCPDRRIDRLCIDVLFALRNLHVVPARSLSRRECDGFLVAFTFTLAIITLAILAISLASATAATSLAAVLTTC